jgi:hypothetical protein
MSVKGQNQQSRFEKAAEFQGGTVHLLDSSNAISDSATSIASNASSSTADSDWSITNDNITGTTTLENVNSIGFGSASGFVIDQIVIESSATTGNFIIDNSPTGDIDLSGDGSLSLPAGDLSYVLGSQ